MWLLIRAYTSGLLRLALIISVPIVLIFLVIYITVSTALDVWQHPRLSPAEIVEAAHRRGTLRDLVFALIPLALVGFVTAIRHIVFARDVIGDQRAFYGGILLFPISALALSLVENTKLWIRLVDGSASTIVEKAQDGLLITVGAILLIEAVVIVQQEWLTLRG